MTCREPLFDWLRWVVRYEAWTSQDYKGNDADLHQALGDELRFRRVSEPGIEKLLLGMDGDGETYGHRSWIYLPCPRKGKVRLPLMNVLYDFSGPEPSVSFQVGCFWLADGSVRCTGWRFECPERPHPDGTPGRHGYFHAQPSFSLRTKKSSDVELVWPPAQQIPDDGPTFPLSAADPLELLVCMLGALYGRTEAGQLVHGSDVPALIARMSAAWGGQ